MLVFLHATQIVTMSAMQTIYVQNLNENVKLDELKEALCHIFTSRCGPVLDVSCRKSNKYRGQAWVTFNDVSHATKAVNTLNGFLFYGKPLKIFFSKNKADIIAKADGTYVPREKKEQIVTDIPTKRHYEGENEDAETYEPKAKIARREDEPGKTFATQTEEATVESVPNPPHNILFVSGLPQKVTSLMVENLFNQAGGFLSAKMHDSLPGVAFIEFDSTENSTLAMNAFQNYQISQQDFLKITFSK